MRIMNQRYWQVARYLIAGGSFASTNFGLLYVLTEFYGMWYLLSALCALIAALIVSFVLQKFWTFTDRSLMRIHIQFPLHVLLGFSNIVFSIVALYLLVEYLHLWYVWAQVFIAVCVAAGNYFIYRRYIFNTV